MNWKSIFGMKENLSQPIANWTDLHSHILPGIDDGSPDVATSIALVKGLMELGCNHIVATPHIIGDIYPNNLQTIDLAAKTLQKALKKEKIFIRISFAAEYMLDDFFLDLLTSDSSLLTFGPQQYILTEFSYAIQPSHVEEMLTTIVQKGYQPILAHPERYHYFHHQYKVYHYLKEMGFHLQLNLLSLTGFYGRDVQKAADYLLKNHLVDFAGSDLHNLVQLDKLSHCLSRPIVNNLLEEKNPLITL